MFKRFCLVVVGCMFAAMIFHPAHAQNTHINKCVIAGEPVFQSEPCPPGKLDHVVNTKNPLVGTVAPGTVSGTPDNYEVNHYLAACTAAMKACTGMSKAEVVGVWGQPTQVRYYEGATEQWIWEFGYHRRYVHFYGYNRGLASNVVY